MFSTRSSPSVCGTAGTGNPSITSINIGGATGGINWNTNTRIYSYVGSGACCDVRACDLVCDVALPRAKSTSRIGVYPLQEASRRSRPAASR